MLSKEALERLIADCRLYGLKEGDAVNKSYF